MPKSPQREESEEESFIVERVISHKVDEGEQKYKVRWQGYSRADDTWEPEENFFGDEAKAMLDEYKSKHGLDKKKSNSAKKQTPVKAIDLNKKKSDTAKAADLSLKKNDSVKIADSSLKRGSVKKQTPVNAQSKPKQAPIKTPDLPLKPDSVKANAPPEVKFKPVEKRAPIKVNAPPEIKFKPPVKAADLSYKKSDSVKANAQSEVKFKPPVKATDLPYKKSESLKKQVPTKVNAQSETKPIEKQVRVEVSKQSEAKPNQAPVNTAGLILKLKEKESQLAAKREFSDLLYSDLASKQEITRKSEEENALLKQRTGNLEANLDNIKARLAEALNSIRNSGTFVPQIQNYGYGQPVDFDEMEQDDPYEQNHGYDQPVDFDEMEQDDPYERMYARAQSPNFGYAERMEQNALRRINEPIQPPENNSRKRKRGAKNPEGNANLVPLGNHIPQSTRMNDEGGSSFHISMPMFKRRMNNPY